MKMKTPEISVVRFDEEDILTASGDSANWSLGSFFARDGFFLYDKSTPAKRIAGTNYEGFPALGDGIYNYVDRNGSDDTNGDALPSGKFYHFDLNSFVGADPSSEANIYWNWKTCTDESHHYLVDPGK